MEQNLPIKANKLWSIVRVLYFMVRKGISKAKLLADLSVMMKRGKIAGKAIHNLLFHHAAAVRRNLPINEYEFSCSNSPAAPPFDGELLEILMNSTAASPALPDGETAEDNGFSISVVQ